MSDLEQQARKLHADGHQLQFEEQFDEHWRKIGERLWHYPLCGKCAELTNANKAVC